jgi:hypothetical protein
MGLQNLDPRFESGCRLHKTKSMVCRDGGIGRRKGLKILRTSVCAGSSPALGTIYLIALDKNRLEVSVHFEYYMCALPKGVDQPEELYEQGKTY